MIATRRDQLRLLSGAATGLFTAFAVPPDFNAYTDAQKERLLKLGKIVKAMEIGHGVTKPVKATVELDGVQHDAEFQVVNEELPRFFPQKGPPVPMKDFWGFNIAAYKVDRLLGMNMVPVTIQRAYNGKPAALSWWVDDVMFEEIDRVKKEMSAPNAEDFARQRAIGQVFDELIINIDRNLANLLITKSWKVALIDHTRSFTAHPGIRNEENLIRCSRAMMAKMKALTISSVAAATTPHLTAAEVKALIGRRDRIVEFFDKVAKVKGEENVFFP
jgi:hypothetical protein